MEKRQSKGITNVCVGLCVRTHRGVWVCVIPEISQPISSASGLHTPTPCIQPGSRQVVVSYTKASVCPNKSLKDKAITVLVTYFDFTLILLLFNICIYI